MAAAAKVVSISSVAVAAVAAVAARVAAVATEASTFVYVCRRSRPKTFQLKLATKRPGVSQYANSYSTSEPERMC